MTGEYIIRVKPLMTKRNSPEVNWRNADVLSAEATINIDGENRVFRGTLKRDE